MSEDVLNPRAAEVARKLHLVREALAQAGAGAIRLRGVDWFAWATAGGDASVLLAADLGVADLLVTPHEACVLTDEIEAERLRREQLADGLGLSFHIAPWAETELHDTYVLGAAAGAPVLSDHPRRDERPLPPALRLRRMVLEPGEQERYRALGGDAAAAMAAALRAARPHWTEHELAAAGARELLARGIQPALVLAAGERRLPLFRHPLPTHEALGGRAMLVFCARRHGLYANLTRFVAFGAVPDALRAAEQELLRAEATGLDAVRPGQSLAAVYHALDAAYRHANRPDEIRRHHQGGITGYAAREIVASASTATGIETGMAFAFNPSFAGVKVEDTFLLGPGGLDNLTLAPDWPATTVDGRARPLWLEGEAMP
ncbi:Xaa-Pro peptidase family protein [uncultured Massilia sp.]|uniref:M24 family metallopeptidase n=1 Tax=uncultured Massilia sp. TaxID=169973 RepID=UPI0025D802EB|nr:M24 family metallopeptidase [uncultured Massilia sp.]